MTEIVVFLTARLDEDEQIARHANGRTWIAAGDPGPTDWVLNEDMHLLEVGSETVEHIARHDPARVLCEVAAKRKIAERHSSYDFPYNPDDGPGDYAWTGICGHCHEPWPCPDLRDLAAVYDRHPDFDPAWRL